MNLNTLSPEYGSRKAKKRLGRGIGSGLGKTAGKGHKGQKARAGGFHKINFEGGQMPIQRRLPKMGFKSAKIKWNDQVTLSEISTIEMDQIDLNVLKQVKLVPAFVRKVKVILSGEVTKPVKIVGLNVTKGARQAIENAGGSVE
ncbi:MAG: 50S ribosomal protein L15 [Legionella sp.]|nr:50S ribosomal protein L15 [Legionella sp.]